MAAQGEHDETLEDNEYVPATQGVHVDAPALVPVFVMDPASQFVHEETFDDAEYKPGAQSEQVDAPALVPVFVMEPAAHSWQEASPGDP